MKKLLGIVVLSLLLAPAVFSGDKIELTAGQISFISDLQNQGMLSIEPKFNRAFVDPILWQKMKYSLKQDFAATLAIYCGNKKGTQLYWVEIYDQYSGKKLAKFSHAWGFKVY